MDERLSVCHGAENPIFNLDRLNGPGVKTITDRAAAISEKETFVIQVNSGAQGGVHANVDGVPADCEMPDPLTPQNTVELA